MSLAATARVIRTYRFYAPVYDRLFGAVLEPGRRALAQAVYARGPRTVLEIGVGTGLTLRHYPAAAAVTGIDFSEEMIGIARRRAARVPERRIELLTMNAEAMAFPDQAFDCVTLPYVLSVTPDPERLCAEIRRVCRKDGTILVLNHFSGSARWWLLEQVMRIAGNKVGFRAEFSYEEQILRRGWQVRSVKDVNLWGLSKLVEIRNA